jgi:hypothetical protein
MRDGLKLNIFLFSGFHANAMVGGKTKNAGIRFQ